MILDVNRLESLKRALLQGHEPRAFQLAEGIAKILVLQECPETHQNESLRLDVIERAKQLILQEARRQLRLSDWDHPPAKRPGKFVEANNDTRETEN